VADVEVDERTQSNGQIFVAHEVDASNLFNNAAFRRYVLVVSCGPEIFLDLLRRMHHEVVLLGVVSRIFVARIRFFVARGSLVVVNLRLSRAFVLRISAICVLAISTTDVRAHYVRRLSHL
jgi:hypothetical protein